MQRRRPRQAFAIETLEVRLVLNGIAVSLEDALPGGAINLQNAGSTPTHTQVIGPPALIVQSGGTAWFAANDGINGVELWHVSSSGVAEMVNTATGGPGIAPGPDGSAPSILTDVNDILYFGANDGVNGHELWRINGDGDAEMVEDGVAGGGINPDSASSSPVLLTDVNGVLYFRAFDGMNGEELWRINSSGLAEMVEDGVAGGGINPGSGDTSISDLTNASGILYFNANDGSTGTELWRINSSGFAEMVEDAIAGGGINPGTDSSSPRGLTDVAGTLYFIATDVSNGRELWRINSSGLAEIVEDAIAGGGINPDSGSTSISTLTDVAGTLYFSAADESNGIELWRINGSGLAEMVEDAIAGGGINPGTASSSPRDLTDVAGTLYFNATDAANGRVLRRINSSGLAEMVEDSVPGGGIATALNTLTLVNGRVYFDASDSPNGSELWTINGDGFAQMVEDAIPGGGINPGYKSSNPSGLTDVNGVLYFQASDGTTGTELWRINSSGIAQLVEDPISGGGINPGVESSTPEFLTSVNGTLFFRADDGTNGAEVWRINSSGFAELVEDSIPGGGINHAPLGADLKNLTSVNGALYFSANDGINGTELWRVDGHGLPKLVEDSVPGGGLNPGFPGSSPFLLTDIDGTLYFRASTATKGSVLWRINGNGIAEIVEYIHFVGSAVPLPYALTNMNGTLYFVSDDGSNGVELLRINSSGFAEMIQDTIAGGSGINPGGASSNPTALTVVSGTLFFSATDGTNGIELWRINSSGFAEMVEDSIAGGGINPSSGYSNPVALISVNGRLYFSATDGTNGTELWRVNSNGLAEMVEDAVPAGGINPGSGSSSPGGMTVVNGILYFLANDGTNGSEIWRINSIGLAEMIEDSIAGGGINPGAAGSFAAGVSSSIISAGGTLYVRANDGTNGAELWRINNSGFAEMVEDSVPGGGINPGSGSAQIERLTNVNGQLYFRANDGTNGEELWRVNSGGFVEMVEDGIAGGGINPGSGNAMPRSLTNVNGILYFTASDGTTGTELWTINAVGQAQLVEDSIPGGGINPGFAGSSPNWLTNANGTLYFSAITGSALGGELFVVQTGIQPAVPVISAPDAIVKSARPRIMWNAVAGTTGYEVWINNRSVVPQARVLLETVVGTSWTVPEELGIGNHTVWIRSLSLGASPSAWSIPRYFQVRLPVVLNVIGHDVDNGLPRISWVPLKGAVKYDVWIDRTDVPTSQVFRDANVTGTSVTPSSLPHGGHYRVWVRGIAVDGNAGSWSPMIDYVAVHVPAITGGLNPTFDTSPTITWLPVANASTYNVYVLSVNGNFRALHQKNISGTSFTWPALPAGPYRYWVKASGASVWSRQIDLDTSGHTQIVAFEDTAAPEFPRITWQPVDGAVRYEIQVDHLGVQQQIIHATNVVANSFKPSGNFAAGGYRAWVRAFSASAISPWSPPFDLTLA